MLYIIKFACILSLLHAACSFLCSDEFCDSYFSDNDCPTIPENCEYQNSTHNGIILPFPGPCSCCDYCLENLVENDRCALGGVVNPLPAFICGDSLQCTADPITKEGTCQPIVTKCSFAQRDYDYKRSNGLLGYMELRPNCDTKGRFEPYKCIPGEICYCVDPFGNRIFGEIPYTQHPELFMRCGCSRDYTKASNLMGYNLHVGQYFRCLSNGDYDPMQCIDDECFCVHRRDGLSSIDSQVLVNISLIQDKSPSCFDQTIHVENEYRRDCELKYLESLDELDMYEEDEISVFGFVPPECQLDGYYGPVQTTKTTKYCSDLNGTKIENFELLKTNMEAFSMDCKCARIRSLSYMRDKPKCCSNGNYKPIQCRRGLCRCVDNDGHQVGIELEIKDVDKLPCASRDCA